MDCDMSLQQSPGLIVLDLNDTLIGSRRENGFVTCDEDWYWTDGALDALRGLAAEGWQLAVATNQSAHVRAEFGVTLADVEELLDGIRQDLENVLKVPVPFYVCWHGPDADCECRKPAPGLVLAAMDGARGSIRMTVVVGDKDSDMEAGRRAGTDLLVKVGCERLRSLDGPCQGPQTLEIQSVAKLPEVLCSE